jgi:hypothetical protein
VTSARARSESRGLPDLARSHRTDEIAQCLGNFGWILIDKEVATRKRCLVRIAEALAPLAGAARALKPKSRSLCSGDSFDLNQQPIGEQT